ncbi:hypothetical protein OROMI_030718 [Orobanche minor]
MSPSIISFPNIFIISLILILISTPQNTVANHPSLIQRACSNDSTDVDTELCLRVLPFVPSVASAKDLSSLLIAIIKAGISNSTNTRAHIEKVLNNQTNAEPRGKEAFRECKLSYDQVVELFTGALEVVGIRDYEAASYSLLIASTDKIKSCQGALTSQKVEDRIIFRANKIVLVFGLSAFTVIEMVR